MESQEIDVQREQRKSQLRKFLEANNIPLERWGQGKAKTLDDLFEEIEAGEATLDVLESGEVLRRTKVVSLDVRYEDASGQYALKEDRQEFTDGRIRKRELLGSLSEKMKPNETPQEAAERALIEELGIEDFVKTDFKLKEQARAESNSYPGLISQHTLYRLSSLLGPHQFKPEGYIEKQADKTTFFKWIKRTEEVSVRVTSDNEAATFVKDENNG